MLEDSSNNSNRKSIATIVGIIAAILAAIVAATTIVDRFQPTTAEKLIGTWEGLVENESGATFTITITVHSECHAGLVCAEFYLQDFQCGGKWQAMRLEEEVVFFKAIESECDIGQVVYEDTLKVVSRGEAFYQATSSVFGTSSGTVYRVD